MLHLGENIPLCLGIPSQIAPHDLLLAQHLHGLKPFLALLLHQLYFAETALAKHHVRHEVFRLDLFVKEFCVFVF